MTFESARALAVRLIAAKGQAATYNQQQDGSPTDPDKPWRTTAVDPVGTPVTVVEVTPDAMGTQYQGNGDIQQDDRILLVAGDTLGFKPSLRDQVTYGGYDWSILHSLPLSPNGEDILWTLQVRR